MKKGRPKLENSGSPKTIFMTPETRAQIEFLSSLGIIPFDSRGSASRIIALAVKNMFENAQKMGESL